MANFECVLRLSRKKTDLTSALIWLEFGVFNVISFSASPLESTDTLRTLSVLTIGHSSFIFRTEWESDTLSRVFIAAQMLSLSALHCETDAVVLLTIPAGFWWYFECKDCSPFPTSCVTLLCKRSMWFYFRPHQQRFHFTLRWNNVKMTFNETTLFVWMDGEKLYFNP